MVPPEVVLEKSVFKKEKRIFCKKTGRFILKNFNQTFLLADFSFSIAYVERLSSRPEIFKELIFDLMFECIYIV